MKDILKQLEKTQLLVNEKILTNGIRNALNEYINDMKFILKSYQLEAKIKKIKIKQNIIEYPKDISN